MSSSEPVATAVLDATGLRCPEPLLLVRNRLRGMNRGDVLHILATDPSTARDFHNLCRFMGHRLLEERTESERLEFWIEKG